MAYLVRHAHAGNKHHWVGPDQDRPLSLAGQGEARGLLTRLGSYPISRILSGPAIRCQQTVAPLAARYGLPIELTKDLAVEATADQLLVLIADPALRTAVLCSHGEVIGQVLQQLAAGGLTLADPLRWEKGSTWVLDSRGGVVVGARYLAPLRHQGLARRSEEAVSGGPCSP
jgi:phosphohistidine phosphatase SixA